MSAPRSLRAIFPARQSHLCEGRQRLQDRGPSLVRGAVAAEVNEAASAQRGGRGC
jgi:hypothetical protein